ncbi:NepR family anti-sigma factor [Methylobacterium nigriterrae]|uniref:NepR family anti-sigma factor n=1 Tax=Methylobacterium nigriterrae TaxID=3127512 RepID=UPI003013EBBD
MTNDGKAGDLRPGGASRAALRRDRGEPSANEDIRGDDEAAPVGRRTLSEQTQRRLGTHLRAMYDSIVQQPVPDRFRDLIARLDTGGPDKA